MSDHFCPLEHGGVLCRECDLETIKSATVAEALEALLQHNEVKIDVLNRECVFVAVFPRGRAPVWYSAAGPTLAEALSKAVEHRLAKVGSPAPAGTKEGNKQ